MEMTKEVLKQNKIKLEWKKIENYVFPLLAMCFVLLEDAFLFNPLILACLFVTYRKSGITYFLTFFTLVLTASMINISYSMELILIGLVQFFLSFSLVRLTLTSKYKEYYPLLILCLLISGTMIINSFSLNSIINCFISTILTCFLVYHGFEINKSIEDDSYDLSKLSYIVAFLVIFIGGMSFPIFGLILIRVALLKEIKKNDVIISMLLMALVFITLFFLYDYSLNNCLMVLLPCLVMFIDKKKTNISLYFIFTFIISLVLDPLFYTNGLFYQSLIAGIIFLTFPFKKNKKVIKKTEKERTLEVINHLQTYLNAINFEFESNPLTPKQKAVSRVYQRVCSNCEHLEYCKLTKSLKDFVLAKINTEMRKTINKECIKPYKLTLELQQGYQIFISSESYYQEVLKRKEMLLQVLDNIKTPLKIVKEEILEEKDIKTKIKEHFLSEQIIIKEIKFLNNIIIIEFENIIDDEKKELIKNIIHLYTNKWFDIANEYISYLRHEYVIEYEIIPNRNIRHLTYTKAASCKNGDYITYDEINNKKIFLLCDGMGHDERAYFSSKSVASTFLALYKQENNINRSLQQINNMFRVGSTYDNYSTFDFMEIDLQTLELISIKAGSVDSYVIRDDRIISIGAGGLPLGVLDDVDYKSITFQLQIGDILLMVSDGIGEFIKDLDKDFYKDISNENEFFRNLFNLALLNMKHLDDASMIVCKIL